MTVPPGVVRRTPPGNEISPPLECSIPYSGPPGCDSLPISPVGMSKSRAVLAFLMAMSTEPSQAPSIRRKALRLPPASTTAMFIFAPSATDLTTAASTTARAAMAVMS